MIQLKNLHKFYNIGKQNEIHVINDVSLELPDSGMCAIFGPSGCGKTTLLNVIGGLDSTEAGEILVNDGAMSKNNKEFDTIRNRDIGVIFQNYNLNRRESVFDNVADSLRLCGITDSAVITERVTAALANVGMEKFAKRLPDTLSGGQQQRVAIARAIVKNPKVILADEPTGNLDEANTILVMDILKAMSAERLILLVTHEAELVDSYCDTVIELKDGCVVNTRHNEAAEGYVARNKNDIFLGELSEHVQKDNSAEITYFGDKPETPVKLTVVNHDGRLFLRIDTPRVTVLDDNSEVNLRQGVYKEVEERRRKEESVDMSKLPPIEGKEYGRLFHFLSALKSGYRDNFKSMMKKKSKKRLAFCLMLFGAAFVFLTAMFGRGLGDMINAKDKYDAKVLYVAAMTDDVAPVLEELAKDPSAAIDYWGLGRKMHGYPTDPSLNIRLARFVTSGYYDAGMNSASSVSVPMTVLPESMMSGKILNGTGAPIASDQIVITKRMAKQIIKQSSLGYIDDYEMLLGLSVTSSEAGMTKPLIIAGIVDSDEVAAFVNEFTLAEMQMSLREYCEWLTYDKDGYFGVAQGECVLLLGKTTFYDEFEKDVKSANAQSNQTETPEEDPETPEDPDGDKPFDPLSSRIEPKDIIHDETRPPMPKPGDTVYYNGIALKVKEVRRLFTDDPDLDPENKLKVYEELDEHLPLNTYGYYDYNGKLVYYADGFLQSGGSAVILSKEDYLEGARVVGKTTRMLELHRNNIGTYTETSPGLFGEDFQAMFHYQDNQPRLYYVIHSTDPKATSAKLKDTFRNLEAPSGIETIYVENEDGVSVQELNYGYRSFYTDEQRLSAHLTARGKTTVRLLTIGGVMLLFLCLCMYFIMKSTIMNRVREIGIYRAIGTTKKNVRFRFAVETGVVVTCSVFVGFLAASGIVWYVLHVSSLSYKLFYYPLWMALIVAVFLYAVSITCGMLPLFRLMRKTPAEILAKYDI